MWLLKQNKAHNIFHSILSSDKGITFKENYKETNSDKSYIVVVVCLLVTLNQWKQLNLLFIQQPL